MDKVCQHIQHRQVVFNHDDPLGFGQLLDDSNNAHALVNVKIGRRLVKEIHVNIAQHGGTDGHALQLPSRQLVNLSLEQMVNTERFGQRIEDASFIDPLE